MGSTYFTWDMSFTACDYDRLLDRGFVDSHGKHDSAEAFDELVAAVRKTMAEWYVRVGKHVLDCAPSFMGDIDERPKTSTSSSYPTVGRIVHFTPDNEPTKACRPAIVTGATNLLQQTLDLCVISPVGMTFERDVRTDYGCIDEPTPSTWHWPERTD